MELWPNTNPNGTATAMRRTTPILAPATFRINNQNPSIRDAFGKNTPLTRPFRLHRPTSFRLPQYLRQVLHTHVPTAQRQRNDGPHQSSLQHPTPPSPARTHPSTPQKPSGCSTQPNSGLHKWPTPAHTNPNGTATTTRPPSPAHTQIPTAHRKTPSLPHPSGCSASPNSGFHSISDTSCTHTSPNGTATAMRRATPTLAPVPDLLPASSTSPPSPAHTQITQIPTARRRPRNRPHQSSPILAPTTFRINNQNPRFLNPQTSKRKPCFWLFAFSFGFNLPPQTNGRGSWAPGAGDAAESEAKERVEIRQARSAESASCRRRSFVFLVERRSRLFRLRKVWRNQDLKMFLSQNLKWPIFVESNLISGHSSSRAFYNQDSTKLIWTIVLYNHFPDLFMLICYTLSSTVSWDQRPSDLSMSPRQWPCLWKAEVPAERWSGRKKLRRSLVACNGAQTEAKNSCRFLALHDENQYWKPLKSHIIITHFTRSWYQCKYCLSGKVIVKSRVVLKQFSWHCVHYRIKSKVIMLWNMNDIDERDRQPEELDGWVAR